MPALFQPDQKVSGEECGNEMRQKENIGEESIKICTDIIMSSLPALFPTVYFPSLGHACLSHCCHGLALKAAQG